MSPVKFWQMICFRARMTPGLRSFIRKTLWRLQGAHIGRRTNIPSLRMTWPHQVKIGERCILERDVYFKFDGLWGKGPSIVIGDETFIGQACEFNIGKSILVGRHSLIASGCKFIDHDHEVPHVDHALGAAGAVGSEASIELEDNVWLGTNVIVLKGVTIGRGAIVGAGAVVTRSIPPFEIWAGVPARKIGERPGLGGPLGESHPTMRLAVNS